MFLMEGISQNDSAGVLCLCEALLERRWVPCNSPGEDTRLS